MQAGKLRHRLAIEKKLAGSPQRTSTGQQDSDWTALATVYGALNMLTGKRLEASQASWPRATYEARVRWREDIWDAFTSPTPLRVSFGGRYYPIEGLDDFMMRKTEFRMMLSVGAAVG